MIEKQRHISDLLRGADKELRNGNLDLAMGYIQKITELELKNVYAKAYRERIVSLWEAQGLSRAEAEKKFTDTKPIDLPSAKTEEPKVAAKIVSPVTVAPLPPPPPVVPKAPVAPKPMPVESAPARPVVPAAPTPAAKSSVPASPKQQIKRSAAATEAYRTLLLEIWKDGAISAEEQGRIDSMRETFAITPAEHQQLEKEVRITSYLNALRDDWKKGITDFELTRKKFLVTDQEQISIEPKVFQLIQSLQANGSVLVLDDEESFLSVIKGVLEEGGYYCFTAVTGEEGLRLLETMTPDIVICDINFAKPNMSGFAFYEKFRSIEKFITTPFIFLSALDQDVLVRTGKKLGADDYLFKPIDTEMLLATVEGKLRRSRELKRIV